MEPRPPTLSGLLRDPRTPSPIRFENGRPDADFGPGIPITGGFPDFRPSREPMRHRFWAWVYNRLAFGYDFGVRAGWRLSFGGAPIDRGSYLSRIEIRPGMRVLETAVGTGDNLLGLPPTADCYGFDLSPAMLRRCRGKLERAGRAAALVLADMAEAPFVDDAFDVVLHMGGLQFLSDPRRGIAEMHRMAAPGGQVLVVEESASTRNLARRSNAGNLAGLVPDGAVDPRIETISNGELIAIEFYKN